MSSRSSSSPLPLSQELAYATGTLGWSLLINIVAVMLIYFYLPPKGVGLVNLVPQITLLIIFNPLSLIASSGRLLDAITDPLIAHWSDRSHHPKGRRIPFMRAAAAPAGVFCLLIFVPLEANESGANLGWLALISACYYVLLTLYVVPYNALLPELGRSSAQKLSLSTWQSAAFVMGIILSSQIPALADLVQFYGSETTRMEAFQIVIGGFCLLAIVCMYIPVWTIDERRYAVPEPSTEPLLPALMQTLGDRNFLRFIFADFSYFIALALISSGLLYYVTSLLGLPEAIGGKLMGLMVVVSFVFYPLINWAAKHIGKKPMLVFAFVLMALIFLAVYFLGRFPFSSEWQAYLLALSYALPLALQGILPNAIIAEVAEEAATKTGQKKEGMYYAVRTFSTKLGQTMGLMIFAMLTLQGKDPGDDLGIRLSGIVGAVLCLAAAWVLLGFQEKRN